MWVLKLYENTRGKCIRSKESCTYETLKFSYLAFTLKMCQFPSAAAKMLELRSMKNKVSLKLNVTH